MPKKPPTKKSRKPKAAPPSAQRKSSAPNRNDEALKKAAALAEAIAAPPLSPNTTASEPNISTPTKPTSANRGLPAEAALSFLRDTKGAVSWSLRDMSRTLNISREEATRVVSMLQIQGYVQQEAHKPGEWLTTPSGETVSGAKPPRYDRKSVEGALAALQQRIEESNKDSATKLMVTAAVAFGDFLAQDRARLQAADVGIELTLKDRGRKPDEFAVAHSAVEARQEQALLRQLRGRSALINLKPYADWMSKRMHQKLV